MQFQFFTIPINDPQTKTDELNRFLASNSVESVRREFVQLGEAAYWAICVEYLVPSSTPTDSRKSRIDYRTVLSEKDFAVFSRLREWRKEAAEKDKVPLYTLFTNEQLADIVRTNPRKAEDLEKIEGIGEVRIKKYAEDLIKILHHQNQNQDETNR